MFGWLAALAGAACGEEVPTRESNAAAKPALERAASEQLLPTPAPTAGLLRALAEYRRRAEDPEMQAAWREPLPPLAARKLEPGGAYAGLAPLHRRLILMGDLPRETALPERYEGALVEGVTAFQRRHGLDPDGVIGRATLAQLNVAPAARVEQIEANLERLRRTPLTDKPRRIVVNIPEFALRAYAGGELAARIDVIVGGSATDTRTPTFSADMRYVEFSPYWNVPLSIAQKETVPRLRASPGYFDDQGFEFDTGAGGVVATLDEAQLDAVLEGRARLRQRPGPKNALGPILFAFPNRDAIFMHYTPLPGLFRHARRDFSHGCIRVADPLALARFVLRDEGAWDDERVSAAMSKGTPSAQRLREPIPVTIAYLTAWAEDNEPVRFFPDIYELDPPLLAAMRRAAARTSQTAPSRAQ